MALDEEWPEQERFHDFIGVYSISLAIVGIPTNLLSFVVCLRRNLSVVPTFIMIAVLGLLDAMSLCFWNIDHFLHQFFDYVAEDLGLGVCKIITFLQCVSLQAAAWLLFAMTIERFLSVVVKSWRTFYFNVKKAALVCIVVVGVVSLVNIHLLFTISYNASVNATILGECVTGDVYLKWMEVHIFLYQIAPFFLLLITDIMLVKKLFFNNKNQNLNLAKESKSKRRASGISVICLTTLFLILTLPQGITRGFFLTKLSADPPGLSILFASDALAFSYHGLNFFILYFSNKKFCQEVKEMLGLVKAVKRSEVDMSVSGHTVTKQPIKNIRKSAWN